MALHFCRDHSQFAFSRRDPLRHHVLASQPRSLRSSPNLGGYLRILCLQRDRWRDAHRIFRKVRDRIPDHPALPGGPIRPLARASACKKQLFLTRPIAAWGLAVRITSRCGEAASHAMDASSSCDPCAIGRGLDAAAARGYLLFMICSNPYVTEHALNQTLIRTATPDPRHRPEAIAERILPA